MTSPIDPLLTRFRQSLRPSDMDGHYSRQALHDYIKNGGDPQALLVPTTPLTLALDTADDELLAMLLAAHVSWVDEDHVGVSLVLRMVQRLLHQPPDDYKEDPVSAAVARWDDPLLTLDTA